MYLIRLADVCSVDLSDAVTRKIEKNAAKYPADVVRGSSKKYSEYSSKKRNSSEVGLVDESSPKQARAEDAAAKVSSASAAAAGSGSGATNSLVEERKSLSEQIDQNSHQYPCDRDGCEQCEKVAASFNSFLTKFHQESTGQSGPPQ